MTSDKKIWPTGIGGAQCEQCGDTTVVRRFDACDEDFHTDVDGELLCRACVEGAAVHSHAWIRNVVNGVDMGGFVCLVCRDRNEGATAQAARHPGQGDPPEATA